MIIKILSFSGTNTNLFNQAIKIRFTVFTDEQNVDKNIEYDGLDFDASHFIVYIDDVPAATARYRETKDGIKIERMAVLKNFRSFGIGNLLLRHILHDIKNYKREIYLYAQVHALKFYEAAGFKPVGNEFLEANIKHVKMIYSR